MKIVLTGFVNGFGGAQKSMIMLANGLVELDNNVILISLKDDYIVYEKDDRVKYVFMPDHPGSKIIAYIYRFFDLKNMIKKINPDLVISFWLQPVVFLSVMSKFYGFKTIYSERTDPSDQQYKGIIGLARLISFLLVNGFVFQTQGAKNYFMKAVQNKSVVINNPVYIKNEEYTPPTVRRNVIVNVGRLHKQKNQKLLIDAFSKIAHMFPKYSLEIYGVGELNEELENQITILNLNGRVILKGTTKKLYDEILDVSMFVLSSDYEGMPNALMEAMALGIPCVSTDWKPGGVREFINHRKNGWIVESNSIDQLACAMRYLLEHPSEAEMMGINAKNICKTHSVETIFNKWYEYSKRITST